MKITKIEIAGAAMNSTGLPRAMAELTRQNAGTILASIHLPTGKTENLAISTGNDDEHVNQRVEATVKLAKKLDGNLTNNLLLAKIIQRMIEDSET